MIGSKIFLSPDNQLLIGAILLAVSVPLLLVSLWPGIVIGVSGIFIFWHGDKRKVKEMGNA